MKTLALFIIVFGLCHCSFALRSLGGNALLYRPLSFLTFQGVREPILTTTPIPETEDLQRKTKNCLEEARLNPWEKYPIGEY